VSHRTVLPGSRPLGSVPAAAGAHPGRGSPAEDDQRGEGQRVGRAGGGWVGEDVHGLQEVGEGEDGWAGEGVDSPQGA
jgi:hypothetical protein